MKRWSNGRPQKTTISDVIFYIFDKLPGAPLYKIHKRGKSRGQGKRDSVLGL